MDNCLLNLITIIGNRITEIQSDSIVVSVTIDAQNSRTINEFYGEDLVESIKNNQNEIIGTDQISNFSSQSLSIEFVIAELKKRGFYINFSDFVSDNRFEIPNDFYISELDFSSFSETPNDKVEKYKQLVTLITTLLSKARFVSDGEVKTIYLIQENVFIELPINNIIYEDFLQSDYSHLVSAYIEDIASYKEKELIFLRELIDFLDKVKKTDRFQYLLSNFIEFYERCNASFEYYLSNFSFNKVKTELDNSVLEYSKNIRAIINDSQTRLIAIPAAFVLASSQLDFDDIFSIKNILILISSFMFSYIISLFIKNQQNALEIVSDNADKFKNSFKRSKKTIFEEEKNLNTLTGLISSSFHKIDEELQKQKGRLHILQFFNWGISVAMLLILIITKFHSDICQILKQYLCIK